MLPCALVKRARNAVTSGSLRTVYRHVQQQRAPLSSQTALEPLTGTALLAEKQTLSCTSSASLTGIQRSALPKITQGHDTILHAPTGSGKTLAYLAPIMQSLKEEEDLLDVVARAGRPRAIVLVPTRELVQQVKVCRCILQQQTALV